VIMTLSSVSFKVGNVIGWWGTGDWALKSSYKRAY
jgi:hypothetical protein